MKDLERGTGSLRERIAELEARLEQMERDRSASGRSRALMRRVMPAEASTHFRAAAREQLLGIRALVDHWIGRMDGRNAPRSEREDIQID
jgi:hypothetical protein